MRQRRVRDAAPADTPVTRRSRDPNTAVAAPAAAAAAPVATTGTTTNATPTLSGETVGVSDRMATALSLPPWEGLSSSARRRGRQQGVAPTGHARQQ